MAGNVFRLTLPIYLSKIQKWLCTQWIIHPIHQYILYYGLAVAWKQIFNCAMPDLAHSLHPTWLFPHFISSSHGRIMIRTMLFTYLLTSKLSHQLNYLAHRPHESALYTVKFHKLDYISRSSILRPLIKKSAISTPPVSRGLIHINLVSVYPKPWASTVLKFGIVFITRKCQKSKHYIKNIQNSII